MTLSAIGHEVAERLGLGPERRRLVDTPRPAVPLAAHLPVTDLAADSVALVSLALNGPGSRARVRVDGARIAASFGSERVMRIDGLQPTVWAPLSGFWRTGDGWVRTHANYPHHERALRALVGLGAHADAAAFAAAILDRSAADLEDRAAEIGAVVAAVRSASRWQRHPHARIVADAPIVRFEGRGEAAPRAAPAGGSAPLAGIRVLDLTRVIAGPIAARDLAFAGADVLRIDTARLPETGWIHLDTGQGKRSALLDLAAPHDRRTFEQLLAGADVLLTGYRPGALDRFGLAAPDVAERHPGIVTAAVSAWGEDGPWSKRRSFDSIVQAATGIALLESADAVTPGTLPVQALDHSTGHFLAAAIVEGLRLQRTNGGSIDIAMSLARVAHALLRADRPVPAPGSAARSATLPSTGLPVLSRVGVGGRHLSYPPPVPAFDGAPADYAEVGRPWGSDPAAWLDPRS